MQLDNLKRRLNTWYRIYLTKLPDLSGHREWLPAYKKLCERTQKIGIELRDETRPGLENACRAASENLDDYVCEIWYARDNHISSLRQGGLPRDAFEQLKADKEFWSIWSRAISFARNPRDIDLETIAEHYQRALEWMHRFAKQHDVNRFPALVNRCFAGCLPGVITTTVAEGHFSALLRFLGKSVEDFGGNWLRANHQLVKLLDESFDAHPPTDDTPYHRSVFFWWLYEFRGGASEDRQLIFYGSPGTGKTWTAKERARRAIRLWQEVHSSLSDRGTILNENAMIRVMQFHPSFGYEDFIEGIRPVRIKNDDGTFQLGLVDGVFKRFCRDAARWELDYFSNAGNPITEKTTVKEVRDHLPKLNQKIWTFVSDDLEAEDHIVDHLPPHFFIVDEINRAELSRVLGELMYCLEYRGIEGRMKTQYSALANTPTDAAAFLFDDGENFFFVPHNLFFFGTMNIIDRSGETFDFALRRRFHWERLDFDESAARTILKDCRSELVEYAISGLSRLNKRIAEYDFLGPDYCIGHAYIKDLSLYAGFGDTKNTCEFLWDTRLEPLLREYLRGMGKIQNVDARIKEFKESFIS